MTQKKNSIEIPSGVLWLTERELIKRSHVSFMEYCWALRDSFLKGYHTIEICKAIDKAIEDFRDKKSTFLIITVPFRHGKSDIVSRYLPAHFLGEFPDNEVICTSYSAEKAEEFSKFGRNIMRSEQYRKLYPNISLQKDNQGVTEWGVTNKGKWSNGKAQFFGLQGSSTGKGGACIIIDDYCAGRSEAESLLWRNKTWDVFISNIMTRRAPVSIVIICATPWHVDDLIGRIKDKKKEDNFPCFQELKFPAFSDTYPTGTLFPERFSVSWYEQQKATLGAYGTASLMQCDPQARSGKLLKTDKIKIIDAQEFEALTSKLCFVRAWDLASSKDTGDYTSGCLLAVAEKRDIQGVRSYTIYVKNFVYGQWEATERNKIIQDVAIQDGFIRVGVEAFGAYKDAYTSIRDALRGVRSVEKIQLQGDKVAKAEIIIPIMESGGVVFCRGKWNDDIINQFSLFPAGKNDDHVDSLVVGASMLIREDSGGFGYIVGV